MKNHSLIHIVIFGAFLIVFEQLSGFNTAFGLNLMGPPRSILKPEENAFAFELGYSEMDLETFGDVTETTGALVVPDYSKYKIKKLKSIIPSIRLDTNISEDWDLFLRVGVTDATGNITEEQAGGATGRQYDDFEGDFGLSWGIGTRTTFYRQENTTWGATVQVNWINPGESDITDKSDTNFSGTAELNFWEIQLAFGPTIEFDNVRIYGGPFLHFVNGDMDISGSTVTGPLTTTIEASHEIKEESQLGGFVGAQWYLGNNNTLITEAQFSADAWGIGIGTAWKF